MLANVRDAAVVAEVDRDRHTARVVYANPAFFELSGHAPEAVIGYSPGLLQAPETDQVELSRLCDAAWRGETARGVIPLRRADGARRWVELDVVPLDHAAPTTRVMGVARDATEAVRSERLQTLTAWRPNGLVAVIDGQGRLHRFEPARQPVLGHDPDDLVGRDVVDLLHADDAEALHGALAHPAGAGALVMRLRHADGSWRWFELHVGDHRADSRIAGLVLAGWDVSGREQARAELTRRTDQLRLAVEVAGLSIWCLDVDEAALARDAFSSEPVALDPEGPPMSLEDGLARVHAEDRQALREAIQRAVSERQPLHQTFRVVRPSGAWRWLEARGHVACAPDGTPTHVDGVTLDATDRYHARAPGPDPERDRLAAAELDARLAAESAQAELAHATTHDPLTGLINRAELERRIGLLLSDRSLSVVLFIDVDDFRGINNSLGRVIGDAVLGHVASRVTHHFRPPALVGRFGGDKLVVALTGVDLDEALSVAHRLRGVLHEPYEVRGRTVTLSASVGVAVATAGDTVDTVIRNADAAVASAKRGGRGRVAVYDDSLHQQALQRLDTESELRATRHGEQLELHYQPIFSLADGRCIGVEALMRWRHPERGLLHPGAFIDVAEDTGLIVPMGTWAIDRACRAISDRRRSRQAVGTVWVNAAAPQLARPDFATTVVEVQQRHGVRAGELGIELTERTLLAERDGVAAQLQQLHEAGVPIAIDDFGTGYSSMSLLQQYPIDVLKIDRAFVARVDTPGGEAIVRAVVQLAHALDATASAEGVETRQQLESVRGAGCDSAGGFLLMRPQPEDEPMPAQVRC